MNKKNCALIAIVLVLAAVYVVYFTDWFRTKPIIISHTSRPMGYKGREILLFSLGNNYTVTEIKVVPLAEWETNKFVLPLWHLLGKTSNRINHLIYGRNPDGMNPEVEGTRALPLQPGTEYRIFVTAGSAKGSHDFQSGPPSGPSPTAIRTGP